MTRPPPAVKLPMRHGVSPSCVALVPGRWPLLLDFLAERFRLVSRDDWQQRMLRGDVLNEMGLPMAPGQPYQAHTRVYYFRELPPELPVPLTAQIVFQDAYLLVVDKPHFLPVLPSGRYLQETLLVRLKRQTGLQDLVPVHRIDRDTAGLVMFSVNRASRGTYVALFRERAVQKIYEAIAPWRSDLPLPLRLHNRVEEGESFMTMLVVPGEANALTDVHLLQQVGGWARYGLHPVTGRRHQLRVQMAHLGIPIRHDRIYPVLFPELAPGEAPDYSQPLQLLAKQVAFTDPVTGAARVFESALRLQDL